jgi:GNAT superfamily N-acetyltransferase
MPPVDPAVLALAENPNTYTPLSAGDQRLERPRFVLWMGIGADWNVAQRFRFDAAELDDVIAEVRALVGGAGRSVCCWEIGSSARPAGLAERLLERGFAWDEPDPHQVGMLLDRAPPPGPADVAVRPALDADDLRASEVIARSCFGEGELDEDELAEMVRRYDPGRSRRYLAEIDGRPVGTASAAFTGHGVVLNAGSVLEDHRGRGAYRALVRARWDDAVAIGTPALITQAGAMSLPILERLGFTEICRVEALVDRFGERP